MVRPSPSSGYGSAEERSVGRGGNRAPAVNEPASETWSPQMVIERSTTGGTLDETTRFATRDRG